MLYDVGVTRNLCGHVLIEACSADEAEKIAYDRYIKQGRELPDMVVILCRRGWRQCRQVVRVGICKYVIARA